LNMLSTMTMVRLGYVTGNRMTNLQTRNEKLRRRAIGIVEAECNLPAGAAQTALESANWNLPVAVVMLKADVDRERAENALRESNFTIGKALESLAKT
jgi:N-acetylmuramic acid 6-phosphate etherase